MCESGIRDEGVSRWDTCEDEYNCECQVRRTAEGGSDKETNGDKRISKRWRGGLERAGECQVKCK